MKRISQQIWYDDAFFEKYCPVEARKFSYIDSALPYLIIEDFFTAAECDQIVAHLRQTGKMGDAHVNVVDPIAQKHLPTELNQQVRLTENYACSPDLQKKYDQRFLNVKQQIENFFGVVLKESEGLSILGYPPGGKYDLHSDNCDPILGEQGEFLTWKMTLPKRIISTILYLTDEVFDVRKPNECTQGHLTLDYLVNDRSELVTIHPRKGMLVVFPSFPYYSHQVHPVKEGYRMCIVEWYNADILKKPHVHHEAVSSSVTETPKKLDDSLLDKREWLLLSLDKLASMDSRYWEIPKIKTPPFQVFLNDYYFKNRPVILTNAIDAWKAKHWTPDYFLKTLGRSVIVDDNSGAQNSAMKAIIDQIGDFGDGYLDLNQHVNQALLWLEPKGAVNELHHDLTNNFFVQIYGRNKFSLVPALQVPYMYNFNHALSEVDIMKPEPEKFPNLAKVHVFEFELTPGEVLFMPLGWWHHVLGLEESISLTLSNINAFNEFENSYPNKPSKL